MHPPAPPAPTRQAQASGRDGPPLPPEISPRQAQPVQTGGQRRAAKEGQVVLQRDPNERSAGMRAGARGPDRLPSTPAEWLSDYFEGKPEAGAAFAAAKSQVGPVVLVSLCGGALLDAFALVAYTGIKLAQVYVVELDEEARTLGAATLSYLRDAAPGRLPPAALRDAWELGNDVLQLGDVQVGKVAAAADGCPVLVTLGYPGQESSRATGGGKAPPREQWRAAGRDFVERLNAAGVRAQLLVENTPISLDHPEWGSTMEASVLARRAEELNRVEAELGPAAIIDDALLSGRHRIRMYFMPGVNVTQPPRLKGRDLRDVYDVGAQIIPATGPEPEWQEQFNVRGRPRAKGITLTSSPHSWSDNGRRGGAGHIVGREPTSVEWERSAGIFAGPAGLWHSTAIDHSPEAANAKRRALGRALAPNTIAHLIIIWVVVLANALTGATGYEGQPAVRWEGAPIAAAGWDDIPNCSSAPRAEYAYIGAAQVCTGEWAPTHELACRRAGDTEGAPHAFEGVRRFTPDHPFQLNWQELKGGVFFANPPWESATIVTFLTACERAVYEDTSTRGTFVLPDRPDSAWQRKWSKRLRVVKRHGRAYLFRRRREGKVEACNRSPEGVVVYRMGFAPSEQAPPPRPTETSAWARVRAAEVKEAALPLVREEVELPQYVRDWQDDSEAQGRREPHQEYMRSAEWRAAKQWAAELVRELPGHVWDGGFHEDSERRAYCTAWEAGELPVKLPMETWYPAGSDRLGRLRPERWARWERILPEDCVVAEAAEIAAEGYEFTVQREPVFEVFANNSSVFVTELQERVKAELHDYAVARIIEFYDEWLPQQPAGTTLVDFAAVVNASLIVVRFPDDGAGRWCISATASGVNGGLAIRTYPMTNAPRVFSRLKPHHINLRKDVSKAFLVTRLKPASRRLMAFRLASGRIARFTAPMFGGAPAPLCFAVVGNGASSIYEAIMDSIADYMLSAQHTPELALEVRSVGRRNEPFVDDFTASGEPRAVALMDLVMQMEGAALGLPYKPTKDIAGPVAVTLGALMDAPRQRMRPSDSKLDAYLAQWRWLEQHWSDDCAPAPSRHELEVIVGRMGFCAYLARWARLFVAPFMRALHGAPWDEARPACLTALREYWIPAATGSRGALETSRLEVLTSVQAARQPREIIVTDASGEFGTGGIDSRGIFQRTWEPTERELHICLKELTGGRDALLERIKRLAEEQGEGARGRLLEWHCDNLAAVVWMTKGGGTNPLITGILAPLALAATAAGIAVRAVHRPGTYMMTVGSDGASRDYVKSARRLHRARAPPDGGWEAGNGSKRRVEMQERARPPTSQPPSPPPSPPRQRNEKAHRGEPSARGARICRHAHEAQAECPGAAATAAFGGLAAGGALGRARDYERRRALTREEAREERAGVAPPAVRVRLHTHEGVGSGRPVQGDDGGTCFKGRVPEAHDDGAGAQVAAHDARATADGERVEGVAERDGGVNRGIGAASARDVGRRASARRDGWRDAEITPRSGTDKKQNPGPRPATGQRHPQLAALQMRGAGPEPRGRCAHCRGSAVTRAGLCESCASDTQPHLLGARLGVGLEALELMQESQASRTASTYDAGVRRFMRLLHQRAERLGTTVTRAEILPAPGSGRTVPTAAIMAFLLEACGWYKTTTIENTLASLTDYHRKTTGTSAGDPTKTYLVGTMMEGIRRRHAGTQLGHREAVCPMPPKVLAAVTRQLRAAAEHHLSAGNAREAYAYSRDALWGVLAHQGALRMNEALAVRPEHIRHDPLDARFFLLTIPASKTDPLRKGAVLPLAKAAESGLQLQSTMELHNRVCAAVGHGALWFGWIEQPWRPLATAGSIVERHNKLHVPATLGTVPTGFVVKGHSFRRGSINAMRDAGREMGLPFESLRAWLMMFGRWRASSSLDLYLVEDLAGLRAMAARV